MKKSEKILSVSVAAYNLGDMIETNILSFCESKVADDIELIITDDGSKDNTVEIAEKYAKKYPNTIKLIKKANEGPGSTVNSGIKNATGKYFRMVDGDDWVHTENLEEYINLLKSTDVDCVISDYDIYDNKEEKIIKTEICNLETDKSYNIDDVWEKVPYQMHALAYKTSIYKDNNIVLDNCFYTDVEYVLYAMSHCKTIMYFDKSIYVYRIAQAGQSVSVTSMKKNYAQHDLVLNHMIDYYEANKETMSYGQTKFLANRIGIMADTQLVTLFLFDVSREQKKKVKEFVKYIKNRCIDAYNIFVSSKKVKGMILSGYLLYPLIAKRIRKRCEGKK